jgi:hypothetical protein
MLLDSVETREVEVELILPGQDGVFPAACPRLDANYFIEDRRVDGVGFVISEDMPKTGNLDQAIVDFLTPIKNNAGALKSLSPILRVAIYNRALTCSMSITCVSLIDHFCSELDIRVYPTSATEE